MLSMVHVIVHLTACGQVPPVRHRQQHITLCRPRPDLHAKERANYSIIVAIVVLWYYSIIVALQYCSHLSRPKLRLLLAPPILAVDVIAK